MLHHVLLAIFQQKKMRCIVVCQCKVFLIDYCSVIIIVGRKQGSKHQTRIIRKRPTIPYLQTGAVNCLNLIMRIWMRRSRINGHNYRIYSSISHIFLYQNIAQKVRCDLYMKYCMQCKFFLRYFYAIRSQLPQILIDIGFWFYFLENDEFWNKMDCVLGCKITLLSAWFVFSRKAMLFAHETLSL